MKKIILRMKGLVALGISLSFISFIGPNSVSGAPAEPSKGAGCYVRTGLNANDYAFDPTCAAHDVLKLDDDGELDFYVYQDHGQLPEGSWRPSTTFRNTFEMCLNLGSIGIVCGIAKETVTPSGEYKSSFKSN